MELTFEKKIIHIAPYSQKTKNKYIQKYMCVTEICIPDNIDVTNRRRVKVKIQN